MNAPTRKFQAVPAKRGDDPLLVGMIGPPGGGKTYSALRLATGIQSVRGGDIVLIDTEGGRAKKYADDFKFLHVPFDPPFKPSHFLDAISQQLPRNPACVIIDSMSDEHEGEGGVLDWHAEELDRMAGKDYAKRERSAQAAWIQPKRDRVKMMNGLLRITVPQIFCFRAREKTKPMKDERGRQVPTNIGYQPIAPSEIIFGLDLTCILPPRAEGVPVWKSEKIGEDFIIKLPRYLAPFIKEGEQISEAMGKAFAEWASGDSASRVPSPSAGKAPASDKRSAADSGEPGTSPSEAGVPTAEEYSSMWDSMLAEASDAAQIKTAWQNGAELRDRIAWPEDENAPEHWAQILKRANAKRASLKKAAA